jgi:nicotinamidase-related amidase
MGQIIEYIARRRVMQLDPAGYRSWHYENAIERIGGSSSAVVLCDVWDNHWSRGAAERAGMLAVEIDKLCERLRAVGAVIVHAPGDTGDAYEGDRARLRIAGAGPPPPQQEQIDLPPLPIEQADSVCSDTWPDPWPPGTPVWRHQHSAVRIDEDVDVISVNGGEIAAYLRANGVETVFVLGFHTNICILDRPFGIPALLRYNFKVVLLRDLTDALYNPARPPYVNHDSGTQLMVGYIEAFLTSTTDSKELVISPLDR